MTKYTTENIEEWKDSHINKYIEMRFSGWVFVILPSLFLSLVWIFTTNNLQEKIIWTVVIGVIIYFFGIYKIREANKELKKFKNEM